MKEMFTKSVDYQLSAILICFRSTPAGGGGFGGNSGGFGGGEGTFLVVFNVFV
jgi:uncharacterized membrane protein